MHVAELLQAVTSGRMSASEAGRLLAESSRDGAGLRSTSHGPSAVKDVKVRYLKRDPKTKELTGEKAGAFMGRKQIRLRGLTVFLASKTGCYSVRRYFGGQKCMKVGSVVMDFDRQQVGKVIEVDPYDPVSQTIDTAAIKVEYTKTEQQPDPENPKRAVLVVVEQYSWWTTRQKCGMETVNGGMNEQQFRDRFPGIANDAIRALSS